ncbi:hypothetical protein [Pseudoxanthomonas wuyuanensis]
MDRARFRRLAGHVFSIALALLGLAGNAAAASYDDAYYLQWRPDTWTFENASDLLAGGALIGVRHVAGEGRLRFWARWMPSNTCRWMRYRSAAT